MVGLPRLLAVGVAFAAVVGAVRVDAPSVAATSAASVIGQGEPALSFASDGRFFLPPQRCISTAPPTGLAGAIPTTTSEAAGISTEWRFASEITRSTASGLRSKICLTSRCISVHRAASPVCPC